MSTGNELARDAATVETHAVDQPDDSVSPATLALIDAYLGDHPGGAERLIPVLHRVQEELGYLPHPVIKAIAERLGISPIQAYGVVSFYHFFTTVPRGRYQLKVCMGTACFVRNANSVLESIRDTIGLEVGGVTKDRLFSLEQVRCLGACGLAPAMMVNSEVHGHLTRTAVRKLLQGLRAKARQQRAAGEADGE
ncbi:MAG: NAD(P)H-dependent oxidoreductase subunit E [Thermoanaerobaculaceae bacterium]|nr:NAD(P)H-dependent oxidoreductase subunit E [Thermoanaerobaculaceae bacterium]